MSSSKTTLTVASSKIAYQAPSSPSHSLPRPSLRRRSSRSPSMSTISEDAVMTTSNNSSPSGSVNEINPYEVSPDIATLTELLNCEATRYDSSMRLQVQTRLMDLQRDLRKLRKQRRNVPTIVLSPTEDDRETIL